MKKIILLVLTAISIISCNQVKKEEKNNDLQKNNLKGKVKSMKTTIYEVVEKFGEMKKGKILTHWGRTDEMFGIIEGLCVYNEEGNIIEHNGYNSDGSSLGKWIYKYDDKGNKIEGNQYNSIGNLDSKTTYEYDSKGNKIEGNMYYSTENIEKSVTFEHEFDTKGNWIKQITYGDDIPELIIEREIEYYE